MKILLVSDTHNNLEDLEKLAKLYPDFIKIHLGDRGFDKSILEKYNFYYVDGNCDLGNKKELLLNIDNKKIFINHGDIYNVKFGLDKLYYKALSLDADYVFYGHTHIEQEIEYQNITFINPGALKDKKYVLICDNSIMFKRV